MSETTNDPDQIRADIERTRADLSQNVNALGETVAPGNVARHQVSKVTGAAGSLKDRVMGAADSTSGGGSADSTSISDAPGQAAAAARQKTQGNPLAAGLIALGAGWLLGSLLPASESEQQAAEVIKDKAQPLVDEAKTMAQDSADNLKDPAMASVDSLKETAQSAADTVRSDATDAVADVKASASDSTSTVKDQAQGNDPA